MSAAANWALGWRERSRFAVAATQVAAGFDAHPVLLADRRVLVVIVCRSCGKRAYAPLGRTGLDVFMADHARGCYPLGLRQPPERQP